MAEPRLEKENLSLDTHEKLLSGKSQPGAFKNAYSLEFSPLSHQEVVLNTNPIPEQLRMFPEAQSETRLELSTSQKKDTRLKRGDEIVVVDGKRFIKRPKPIQWDNVGDKYYWALLSAIGGVVKWAVMGVLNGILWIFRKIIQGIINRNYPQLRNYEPMQSAVELPEVYLKNRAHIARIFEAANTDNMWGKFFWAFVVSGIIIGAVPILNFVALPILLLPVWVLMMVKKLKIEWMDKVVARAEKIRKYFFGEKEYDLIPVS